MNYADMLIINRLDGEDTDLFDLMDEGTRLLKVHDAGEGRSAKVYRRSDYNEFIVKHYKDGSHQKEADYFTNDKDDAHSTAQHWADGKNAKYWAGRKDASVDEGEELPMNFHVKRFGGKDPKMMAKYDIATPNGPQKKVDKGLFWRNASGAENQGRALRSMGWRETGAVPATRPRLPYGRKSSSPAAPARGETVRETIERYLDA